MISVDKKRLICRSGIILFLLLSVFLINRMDLDIGGLCQKGASDSMVFIREALEDMGIGLDIAEAGEITIRSLWHSAGLPDGKPLNRPQGLCLDQDASKVYVADTDNDRVMMFDMGGQPIGPFLTSIDLNRPYDLVIGPDMLIYISQLGKHRVDVFDKKGVWQRAIPRDSIQGFAPGRMAFDLKGRLMVIDRSIGVIWLMTGEGKVIEKIYEPPKEKKITLLTGIAVDPNERIYIASAQVTPVVKIMDQKGDEILSFGRHGALHDDSFSFPSSLALDKGGRIWVVDVFRHTIKIFSPAGEYLFNIGIFGEEPGRFVYPVDMAIDKKGIIFVLEKGSGRLQAISVGEKEAE